MEYYDLFDKNGNRLDKHVPRGAQLNKGEYFKVIHVWIENQAGEFLIQQRAKDSDPIPYQWGITTGLVNVGETPKKAASREVEEEVGLAIDGNALTKLDVITSSRGKYNTITYVYYHQTTKSIDCFTPNPAEVKAVKYVDFETIQTMIEKKTFWDYPFLLNDKDYFKVLERRLR